MSPFAIHCSYCCFFKCRLNAVVMCTCIHVITLVICVYTPHYLGDVCIHLITLAICMYTPHYIGGM